MDREKERESEGKGRDGDVCQQEQHYIYSSLGFLWLFGMNKLHHGGNSMPRYSETDENAFAQLRL